MFCFQYNCRLNRVKVTLNKSKRSLILLSTFENTYFNLHPTQLGGRQHNYVNHRSPFLDVYQRVPLDHTPYMLGD
jgi:hypothetical protein